MTILSYDEESFKRGLNEHPLPQEVLEDIKTYLDEKLISLIMQNIDIVLDYSFWSREMRNEYISLLYLFRTPSGSMTNCCAKQRIEKIFLALNCCRFVDKNDDLLSIYHPCG